MLDGRYPLTSCRKKVIVTKVELCDDDDFIVLACDGIWDCMSSQQLVDFIHEHINKFKKPIISNAASAEQLTQVTPGSESSSAD
ncbi:hypothetical protein B296_00032040 [Ensete ventricosum]|uniref:protein-serine/threonine phosphatase n=1 Tax=Ensete ventricosum TaxID=4639 RepID=A0A426ZXQ7_ENSVE|nr:hypothetical protein B296_00032040 [Ensete ventricosum]